MSPALKKRLIRIAALSGLAFIIGAGWGLWEHGQNPARVLKSANGISSTVAGARIGGPFTLVDHTGKEVTQQDYEGAYRLIYFGFTSCPAICPTELQKIGQALNALGPAGENIQPLFITVDPERDTPEILSKYVTLFHPRLTGLTGTPQQIKDVLMAYKIYAQKVQDPALTDYTMDHSSFIYFIGPQDDLLAVYRIEDNSGHMVQDIRDRLSSGSP
ncbi:MAG: SCO family protein [Alphaproteobacteria bacterium]|nr:SCO family protein [Alphaproteobacteria bacterium]